MESQLLLMKTCMYTHDCSHGMSVCTPMSIVYGVSVYIPVSTNRVSVYMPMSTSHGYLCT